MSLKPARSRIKRPHGFVVAGCLLAAAGLIAYSLRQPPHLLEVATQFCEAKGWEIDRGPDSCKVFYWTPEGDVIHLVDGAKPSFVKTTRHGVDRPLPALSRAYHSDKVDPADVTTSPDGRWVAWPRGPGRMAAFQEDGNLLSSTRHDLDASHPQPAPSASKSAALDYRSTPAQRLVIDDGLLTMGGSDGDWWAEPTRPVTVSQVQPKSGLPRVRRFVIPLPKGARLQNTAFSPTGDRIAWQLGFISTPGLPRFVYRVLPFLKPLPERMTSLWVSRLDGSGMREIGRVPTPERQPLSPMLSELRWLPDGRKISFFYERPENGKWRSTLYTVGVD